MKKLSIISAAIMGLALVAAPAAYAWPGGSGKPGSSQGSKDKGKGKKPIKPKVIKDVPQATVDAGNIARARRGKGEKLPVPKTKGRKPGAGVKILLPGATKPVRPGQKATAAEIINARAAVRNSPGEFYSMPSQSGRQMGFMADGTRPSATRLNGSPVGSAGETSAAGSSSKRFARRFQYDKNGNLVEPKDGGSPSQ